MKLTKLINSQISANNKSGVGFNSKMNENELHGYHLNKGEVFKSASDSSVNEIEEENNQVNDRFKKVEGYHVVPLPYTGNYMPSRPDLSFAILDDFFYKTNVSETITSVPRIESTASKSSKDSLEQPKDVRPILTKSGNVPVNTAKQSSPRAAVSNSTARYVNTATSRPIVNRVESQVLLKVSRHNNMYSFDQKNIVPSGGLRGSLVLRVAKRKNRTLIEAARTMLADSLLPTTFWAEAVNTACYVQNRVLVTKPHNKTPYELLLGRPPSISFMRPFGCPVTILNTLDPLGKFDGKADEGFLVGYSINSKAFRVFNTRTRKVEENLHINFLENKPNVAGSGPEWLFDIDSLTKSMNYEPVTAGNQTNGDAGIETNVNAGQAGQEKASDHEYILLPLMLSNSPLSSSSQSTDNKDADEVPGKGDDDLSERNDQERIDSSTQDVNTAGPSINTASENINTGSSNINTASPIPNDPSMQSLEATGIFSGTYDDEDVGA
ncbi:ribonuclease H-like domain-containing protein [Tanacetum coccineum]